MDRFTIEVKGKDIEPIIASLKQNISFNASESKFLLYKNPQRNESCGEERHTARLNTLERFHPPGMERFIKLARNLDAASVLKIEPPSQKPFMVKNTHSQASLRFEAKISQLMSTAGIGPKFIGEQPLGTRSHLIIEECVSERTGYYPIHKYRDTKTAINILPGLFGKLMGKIHRYHESLDLGIVGYGLYKEGFLKHLYYRPTDDGLILLDFGEMRMGTLNGMIVEGGKNVPLRELLRNEVRRGAHNLLIGIAYPFLGGVSHRHPSMGTYQHLLDVFTEAYNRETGFGEEIKVDDILVRTR
ncbi:MAG: hypothetical protein V1944_02675 [Candidatus Aenigmatarchaeota archaeon]